MKKHENQKRKSPTHSEVKKRRVWPGSRPTQYEVKKRQVFGGLKRVTWVHGSGPHYQVTMDEPRLKRKASEWLRWVDAGPCGIRLRSNRPLEWLAVYTMVVLVLDGRTPFAEEIACGGLWLVTVWSFDH